MKAIVTVNGADRVGIIAAVSGKLAEMNININDIRQTTMQDQFDMIMMVDTELCTLPFNKIQQSLIALGREIKMNINIRSKDIFDAMHTI